MQSVASANLAALEAKDPALAKRIASIRVEGAGIRVERSTRGHPTVAFETQGGKEYVEDSDDPSAAGKRLAAGVPDGARLVVALGLGLGYHLKALLARREVERVIVVEPSVAFLVVAASVVDLRRVISDPRVEIVVGGDPQQVARGIAGRFNHGTEPGRILTLLPTAHLLTHRSAAIEAEWSERFRRAIGEVLRSSDRNRRAFEEFVDVWRRNLIANVGAIARATGFADLEGEFRGVPAVLVGAGPSLDRCVDRLAGREENVLILATDTALRTLRTAGVRPHLVMSLDATETNVLDFEGVETDGTALAMVPVVDPRIPSRFERCFAGGYGHPWMKFLESRWGALGSVLVSGSVSTAAYDFARNLGASPIILAGVDLAYADGRTHTRGRTAPSDLAGLGRFRPIESLARGWAEKTERELDVPATGGGTVRTTQRMKEWREWFEREISMGTPTIQASEGGARIEGAEEMTLDRALARHAVRRANVARRLDVRPPRRDVRGIADSLRRFAAEARAASGTPAGKDPLADRPDLARLLDWERATWGEAGLRRALESLPGEIERGLAGLVA